MDIKKLLKPKVTSLNCTGRDCADGTGDNEMQSRKTGLSNRSLSLISLQVQKLFHNCGKLSQDNHI